MGTKKSDLIDRVIDFSLDVLSRFDEKAKKATNKKPEPNGEEGEAIQVNPEVADLYQEIKELSIEAVGLYRSACGYRSRLKKHGVDVRAFKNQSDVVRRLDVKYGFGLFDTEKSEARIQADKDERKRIWGVIDFTKSKRFKGGGGDGEA